MTAPTPDERARLRAVAEAATPGPWDAELNGGVVAYRNEGRPDIVSDYCEAKEDAAHIAAFDPPTVLALLDALDAVHAAYADLEAARLETMHQRDEARRKLAAVEALTLDLCDCGEPDCTESAQRDAIRAALDGS